MTFSVSGVKHKKCKKIISGGGREGQVYSVSYMLEERHDI